MNQFIHEADFLYQSPNLVLGDASGIELDDFTIGLIRDFYRPDMNFIRGLTEELQTMQVEQGEI